MVDDLGSEYLSGGSVVKTGLFETDLDRALSGQAVVLSGTVRGLDSSTTLATAHSSATTSYESYES